MDDAAAAAAAARPSLAPPAPLDWQLQFHDPALEAAFRQRAAEGWARLDVQLLTMGPLLELVVLLVSPPVASWTGVDYAMLCVSRLAVMLTAMGVMTKRSAWYKRYRSLIICALRVYVASSSGCFMLLDKAAPTWTPDEMLFMRMVFRSSIPCLVLTAVGHRLVFKKHLLCHSVAGLVSSVWVWSFHGACSKHPLVELATESIGCMTDTVFRRITVLGAPIQMAKDTQSVYPCWMVALFFHMCIGLLLPTIVVYVSELVSRRSFLSQHLDREGQENLKIAVQSRLIVVGLVTIVGSECLWFFLKALSKLLKENWCYHVDSNCMDLKI